jgi:hypothetical protein
MKKKSTSPSGFSVSLSSSALGNGSVTFYPTVAIPRGLFAQRFCLRLFDVPAQHRASTSNRTGQLRFRVGPKKENPEMLAHRKRK